VDLEPPPDAAKRSRRSQTWADSDRRPTSLFGRGSAVSRSLAHGGKGPGGSGDRGGEARNLNPCRWPTLAPLLFFVGLACRHPGTKDLGTALAQRRGPRASFPRGGRGTHP
jgi:hypothetical protein